MADQVGTGAEGSGFSGLALTYTADSPAQVDEILAEAAKAGGTGLKPGAVPPWGGYGGTFADPEGYVWRLVYGDQATN